MSKTKLTIHGPLNDRYLKRMEETLRRALQTHPRLTVIRIDLRLPDNGCFSDNPLEIDSPTFFMNTGPNLLQGFFSSIKAANGSGGVCKGEKGGEGSCM